MYSHLQLLPDDTQSQLVKYLLKSCGTDVANELFFYAAGECNLNYSDLVLTPEQRTKIVSECSMFTFTHACGLSIPINVWIFRFYILLGQEYKSTLTALNKSLNGSSIDDFLTASENAMQSCSMILKKIDKKKDR